MRALPLLLFPLLTACGDHLTLDPEPPPNASAEQNAPHGDAPPPGALVLQDGAHGPQSTIRTGGAPAAAWTTDDVVVAYPTADKGVQGASCLPDGRCTSFEIGPGHPKAVTAVGLGSLVYVAWSEGGVVSMVRCTSKPRACGPAARSAASNLDAPSLAANPSTGEVFVAVNAEGSGQAMLRCDGALASCTYQPIGALSGMAGNTGLAPRVVLSLAEERYVVLSRTADGYLYSLACDLGGTNCWIGSELAGKVLGDPLGYAGAVDEGAHRFVGASSAEVGLRSFDFLVDHGSVATRAASPSKAPSVDAFLDGARSRFLIVADGAPLTCAVDGTNCSPLSGGLGAPALSTAAYDASAGVLWLFGTDKDGVLSLARVTP